MDKSTTAKIAHPKGLWVLAGAEMWERFGYYLMIGILPLFLRATDKGGKGMDNALSIDIVGTYVALVYLTPFIGGLIADRYLGYRKSIFIGGSFMALGYFLLGIPGNNTLLYCSLACIIVGNGFFKPNISTLLGNIYNAEDLKSKKDVAYNVFYLGVNTGAFICNFIAAYLRNNYNWGYAFMAAGVGMVIGLIWFAFGQNHVKHGDVIKAAKPEDMKMSKIILYVFAPAVAAGAIGWFIPGNIIGSDSNDAFIFACVPVIIFYYKIYARCTGFDKKRVGTLFTLFGVAIIFWNIYNQNSTALTIWADTYTYRETPPAAEKMLVPFGFLETVNTKPREVPVLDDQFRTKIGPDGKVISEIGINPYFKNLPKEKWPSTNEDLKLVSTEIYQSINPFWIIILTPIIIGFFQLLTKRGKELSTANKFAWGTIIAGLSSLIMVFACLSTNIYQSKVSSSWIFASYGVFTVSELFMSPVGLSLVSKVAPRRFTAVMMGGWLITVSLGGKISGILAGFWDQFDNKAVFFAISAFSAILAGCLIFPLTRRLTKVVEEATAMQE